MWLSKVIAAPGEVRESAVAKVDRYVFVVFGLGFCGTTCPLWEPPLSLSFCCRCYYCYYWGWSDALFGLVTSLAFWFGVQHRIWRSLLPFTVAVHPNKGVNM